MTQTKAKRKSITKKIRFEVFKRDSFQCQYCGASAPEIVLNVDHIKPVAKGGDNNIMNLITACFDCNAGKSDRTLSDKTALAKQKKQLDELNKKREQLQMLHQYRNSVCSVDEEKVLYITDLINSEITGRTLNASGIKPIYNWVKKFDYKVVLDSVDAALNQYLKFDDNGDATQKSITHCLEIIPKICKNKTNDNGSHAHKDAYYIRAILKNREVCEPNSKQALAAIYSTIDAAKLAFSRYQECVRKIKEYARDCESFDEFLGWCDELRMDYQENPDG